jgi:polyhydroxyalkanoate synthesis regulator phasin
VNLTTQDIALLLSALGLGAVLNSVVKALSDRRKLGADTTSILTSAARELVEPLRRELQTERQERAIEHRQHIEELAYEKAEAASVRRELNRALEDCQLLRRDLAAAQDELADLRARLSES